MELVMVFFDTEAGGKYTFPFNYESLEKAYADIRKLSLESKDERFEFCGNIFYSEDFREGNFKILTLHGWFDENCITAIVAVNKGRRYDHECNRCTFLGRYKKYDLYHCFQGGIIPTVIARFSDDVPDYLSGIDSTIEPLVEAKKRSKARGLPVTYPYEKE